MQIGIIGMGRVGTSIASSLLHQGGAREILVHDTHRVPAEGEILDLAHGAAFYPTASIRFAMPEEMLACDAIVLAAGRNGRPDESRLDLLRDNASIVRELVTRLAGMTGLLVIVANPVDVLTQVAFAHGSLPPARVIGTGTLLDTARLRQRLGGELGVDPRSIHAYVLGEHGDSSVIAWSAARVGGNALRGRSDWSTEREHAIASDVRRAAYEIIRRKGATNHAIGLVTSATLRWALRDERRILTVSRVQDHGPLAGTALSLPAVVGRDGAVEVLVPDLDDAEQRALVRSAETLRAAYQTLA